MRAPTVAYCDEAIKRWQSKLKRAVSTLDRLYKQRERARLRAQRDAKRDQRARARQTPKPQELQQ